MAGQLGVDKLHSKKLIFNHFEESLSFLDRETY